jgi:hypothetical protein
MELVMSSVLNLNTSSSHIEESSIPLRAILFKGIDTDSSGSPNSLKPDLNSVS